jgi:hypothetical protein
MKLNEQPRLTGTEGRHDVQACRYFPVSQKDEERQDAARHSRPSVWRFRDSTYEARFPVRHDEEDVERKNP